MVGVCNCYASYPLVYFIVILLKICMFGGLSKRGLCIFRKLCPIDFLVVGKCSSVLFQSIDISYVDWGDDG